MDRHDFNGSSRAMERGLAPHYAVRVSRRYPCPCCGHLVLDELPGSHEACLVCFWEDDAVQLRWPTVKGGANSPSLREAQRNYQGFGACDQRGRLFNRPPTADEPLDPAWRPVDLTRDSFEDWEEKDRLPWPEDRFRLYWWLPSFWRSDHASS